MERLKFTRELTIDQKIVQEMEESVFSNLVACKYCHDLGMDDSVIRENVAKIFDFSEDQKNCKNCKGLKYCNKDPKYLVTNITYEKGVVDRNIIPCKKYLEQINFKKRFSLIDFSDEFFDTHISNDISNLQSKCKKDILKKYTATAITRKSSEWIYIQGDMSTGKSYFAATLCVDAARNKLFDSISFIDVPERFKELSDLSFQKSPKFNDLLDKIKYSEMLVLDDFGNEFKSDFVRESILYPIISFRAKNKLFTIITSNYSIDDIATMYLTSKNSKPKVDQLKQSLLMLCKEEIKLPNLLAL